MLDKKSMRVLKDMYRKRYVTVAWLNKKASKQAIQLLEKHLLIKEIYEPIRGYEITLDGCAVVEERRRSTLYFWVPYIVTTAIAVLSLLVALYDRIW